MRENPQILIGTRKYLQTRNKIKQAALTVMVDKGLEGSSIADIAEQAGVSRGTIYNYFNTVEEVMQCIAGEIESEYNLAIEEANRGLTDPARRLANGLRYYFQRARVDPTWGQFVVRFSLSITILQSGATKYLQKDLEEGIASGRFQYRLEQVPALINIIGGSVLTTTAVVANTDSSESTDIDEQVVEVVLEMLGLPAAEIRDILAEPLPDIELPPDPLAGAR